MRVSIIKADGVVVVDGEARKVDLAALDQRIHAVMWNTERNSGQIEYTEDATEAVEERDFDAEQQAAREARRLNKRPPEGAIMRVSRVRMGNRRFTNWDIVRPYYEAWVAAAPELPPAPTPEELAARQAELTRRAELDSAIRSESLGAAEPKNVADLKLLSRAELRAWFDANFTTDAQLRRLIRWLFMYMIRRS